MATATALTVAQVATPRPPRAEVREIDTDVTLAAASVANIPLNLLIDLINIPHSEWQAVDVFAQAQLWGGSWLVTGPSNIWGTDPADAVRFMAAAAMLIPFPALSGLNPDAPLDADHPLGVLAGNGLAQKFWRFAAAELPVDPSCDAEGCVPTTPVAPITGVRGVDNLLWNVMMFTGMVRFPVIAGLFRVPLSELISGSYGPVQGPSGKVNIVPGFNIAGTIDGPNGENFLPWAGTPIDMNLVEPFVNYLNHLMADPADNPIQLPSLEQLGRTVQTMIAGLVVGFDPYTPGSPLCAGPAYCSDMPASQDYPAIVKVISDLWPGNKKIDAWLEAYDQGIANTPTGDYIAGNINLYRLAEKFWDFSNKPLDPRFVNIGFNPSDLAPAFYRMWKMLGFNPDPLYPDTTTGVRTPAITVSRMYDAESSQPARFSFDPESERWNEGKAAGESAATRLTYSQDDAELTTPPDTTGGDAWGAGGPPVATDESGSGDGTVRFAGSTTERSRDGGDWASDRSGDEEVAVGDGDEKPTTALPSTAPSAPSATDEDAGEADVSAAPKTDEHARDTSGGGRHARDTGGGGRHARDDVAAHSDGSGGGKHARDDDTGDGGGSDRQAA